ncbi:MAG: CHAD domain-containing protein [Candidatus Dormibacteraeota bacterium]|nr:CHAD domain-containing protein [Candidatus Dormibacteraeota bacterium]
MADNPAGLRIRVPLDLSIRRLLADAGYTVESTPSRSSTRTLFDTGDRRLATAGGELSLSRRDGWRWRRDTLGHPKLSPREWTAPVDAPPRQLTDWTRAYRRGKPIAARAAVTVHSRRHQVSDSASALLTVVEERVDERSPAGWTQRIRRLEITDATKGAATAIEVLRGTALEDSPTLVLLRPHLVRAPRVVLRNGHAAGARDLFGRSTTLSLIQWLYFDCELPAGSPDALRKLRIALRRLRSDLQTFTPLLDRAWADALRAELGVLATRLGLVRDGEVMVERLGGLVALLPETERPSALPLVDIARHQLNAARAELLGELSMPGYVKVIDDVVIAVTSPRWRSDDDQAGPARLARRPWRRLRAYVEANGKSPDDAQLHRIRILAKRARYAADMCIPAAGEPAAQCAARLATLQTVLGEHHDAVVTRQWLQRQSQAVNGVSFIAGELAALELRRIGEADEQWRDAWDKASRPDGWRWLRS